MEIRIFGRHASVYPVGVETVLPGMRPDVAAMVAVSKQSPPASTLSTINKRRTTG